MKIQFAVVLALVAHVCFAADRNSIVLEAKSGRLSLESVAVLLQLDGAKQNVGFGMCIESGVPYNRCDRNGSVGYGLCVAAGTPYNRCDSRGTVGYGMCVASGQPFNLCGD